MNPEFMTGISILQIHLFILELSVIRIWDYNFLYLWVLFSY